MGVRKMSGGVPCVIVSATHSGAGKTTFTRALLSTLAGDGLVVQSFKIGPDFIDPLYHAAITGRPCVNLDVWMMGEDGVRDSYAAWSVDADVCVIEAMGALFDGADGADAGSAAHVSRILDIPVIVVLDAYGMTRTTAALIDGVSAFDSSIEISGYVLNRLGSQTHEDLIRSGIGGSRWDRVVASFRRLPDLAVPERHLGLLTPQENTADASSAALQRVAAQLDLERIFGTELKRSKHQSNTPPTVRSRARLALARDAAFCFYYEANLRALVEAGFELVEFSPVAGDTLPPDTSAVYFGGGYPESFAAQLASNRGLASQLCEYAEADIPIYGECGGLMYLGRSLTTFDGVRHAMNGVLPIDFLMDPAFLSIKYVEVNTRHDSLLGRKGTAIRGQEFHQSRPISADIEPDLFDVVTSDGKTFIDGYHYRNVVASYMHLYFARSGTVTPQAFAETAIQSDSHPPTSSPKQPRETLSRSEESLLTCGQNTGLSVGPPVLGHLLCHMADRVGDTA